MCSPFSLQLKLHLSLTANTANPLFVKMASSFAVDQKTGTIIPPLKNMSVYLHTPILIFIQSEINHFLQFFPTPLIYFHTLNSWCWNPF
jgi:hypothetical protein